MVSELDIWRAANLLNRHYGADAILDAAGLIGLTLDRRDLKARLVWLRVRQPIVALQAPSTRTVH